MKKNYFFTFLLPFALLSSCSYQNKETSVKVLFDTKLEAEKAAEKINCIGAHRMGEKWMACESHSSHKEH